MPAAGALIVVRRSTASAALICSSMSARLGRTSSSFVSASSTRCVVSRSICSWASTIWVLAAATLASSIPACPTRSASLRKSCEYSVRFVRPLSSRPALMPSSFFTISACCWTASFWDCNPTTDCRCMARRWARIDCSDRNRASLASNSFCCSRIKASKSGWSRGGAGLVIGASLSNPSRSASSRAALALSAIDCLVSRLSSARGAVGSSTIRSWACCTRSPSWTSNSSMRPPSGCWIRMFPPVAEIVPCVITAPDKGALTAQ